MSSMAHIITIRYLQEEAALKVSMIQVGSDIFKFALSAIPIVK